MAMFRHMAPVLGILALAACGGGDEAASPEARAASTPATQVTDPATQALAGNEVSPAAGGEVIEVRMTMADGGRFEPARITAKPGDVIRFVNVENVHNVHFPAANNPPGVALPPASPYLTSPGQTYELKVEMPAGTYDYQCDPHAAMGMVGQLTVQ